MATTVKISEPVRNRLRQETWRLSAQTGKRLTMETVIDALLDLAIDHPGQLANYVKERNA